MVMCALLLSLLLPLVRVRGTQSSGDVPSPPVVKSNPLDVLSGECLDYRPKHEWWSYEWCYKDKIEQRHFERHPMVPVDVNAVGYYMGELSTGEQSWSQTYQHDVADCEVKGHEEKFRRTATVDVNCCIVDHSSDSNRKRRFKVDIKHDTFIERVEETSPCNYALTVCSELLCTEEMKKNVKQQLERSKPRDIKHQATKKTVNSKTQQGKLKEKLPSVEEEAIAPSKPNFRYSFTTEHNEPVSKEEQYILKEKAKEMFYHGYDSYMLNAFPEADLKPISCKGGRFELIKIPMVTLIDALDTLIILQNFTEFKRAVKLIDKELPSFDFDESVSVFETTIRILGGLVSAHLMAIDPKLDIYSGKDDDVYDDCLLHLATDLGNRLLPAFDTATGIPYGTVNLHSGVPKGETELASTAGAGSLVIEFEVLSCLTGDESFGIAARLATEALFDRRSDLSLVGKHIHIRSGKWHETLSGVGSNSDSFYEYLLKAYLLFRRKEYYIMFQEVFEAVKEHSLQQNIWFNDVDMYSGKIRTRRSESLQAFWPGLEALLGMTQSSSNLLNAFYLVLKDFEFLPEEFDYVQWNIDKKKGSSVYYPLRPELIESTYLQYMTTRDRSWLIAGRSFLKAIESHTRTECGYAAIKDITVMQMDDDMPSYFLSETCKYLYLLFDEKNPFHDRHYIFSTEAHPFDTLQVGKMCASRSHISDYEQGNLVQHPSHADRDVYSLFTDMMDSFENLDAEFADEYVEPGTERSPFGASFVNRTNPEYAVWKEGAALHQELMKCPKTDWWHVQSYHLPESSHNEITARKQFRSTDSNSHNDQKTAKEKKSPAGNLFDMLRSLSSQIQNVGNTKSKSSNENREPQAEEDDEEDPLGTCHFLEDPTRAMNKIQKEIKAESSAVELNVGALGGFSVHVFSDGFVINSHLYGNTMEISGIGQPSMFVKEYNTSHSSAVVAMLQGEIATCDVHVDVNWGPFHDGEFMWKAKNYDSRFVPTELQRKRSCSFAAFGPTSNYATFPSGAISGRMTTLTSAESCKAPHDLSEEKNGVSPATSPTPSPANINEATDSTDDGISMTYEDNVVVADRGSCMFEEKTIAAEKGGARAVVIVNNEPALFMMAGLAQIVEGEDPAKAKLLSHIPTVMLSSTDGEYVRDAVNYLSNKGITSSVTVDIVGLPAVLDSPLMGYSDHPTVRMSEKVIHIHGVGEWSALLTLSAEAQWQLFIVPSSDLNVITPWNVQTSYGQHFCTNSDFTVDPVKSYMQMIHERCPSTVRVKEANVIEIKK